MIKLNVKERILSSRFTDYELTPKETRVLLALANNEFNSYDEISKYVYGYSDKNSKLIIKLIKYRICKKIKDLKITTITKNGYRLLNEIEIE